ncbi:HlyD family secretion protein [Paracoccus aestuariivivens]|uniref:HlyD family efflux transporter periplasmic adaptor subunit n=1 Tax=Paracoccus aestuariivivens TaxID=1820333 RepID=A0A6L6JD19_9RHOB|nr:HlyD family secretion protein [Paracoccus aestuariivivens]MTH78044.1 HlyD family efflux transporter periplasmic adaptor subunit [Paracoccus aestuariivivens]
MTRSHLVPTIIALVAGLAGILIVLFAWHLPPFASAQPRTENAYIRGQVTVLAPQLSGSVSSVEVQDFQTVTKGQVIARIDDRQYRQKLAQAQTALQSARAALKIKEQGVHSAEARLQSAEAAQHSAEAVRDTAQQDWDRTSKLRERGVAAQSSADESQLALRRAEALEVQAESAIAVAREDLNGARVGIAASNADIASAEAAVELASIDLANTEIRAPADGRLGQVSVRLGQYVGAGTSLVSVVSPEVWVIANFKETQLHGIHVGDQARFTVDAMQGREFTGTVASFSPATASEFSLLSASNATGNFTKVAQRLPVRIDIDPGQDMSELLEPGLSVVVMVDQAAGASDRTARLVRPAPNDHG